MLYAELVAKRKVAAVVVEIHKNAYFLSYMLAKNIVAVQNLPKERNHFVPLKWIQRKNCQRSYDSIRRLLHVATGHCFEF